jgi:hypothetical protein
MLHTLTNGIMALAWVCISILFFPVLGITVVEICYFGKPYITFQSCCISATTQQYLPAS